MIESHPLCKPPADQETRIWKYLDFPKFMDLITSQGLYFCRFDKFEDPFEGSLPKNSIAERNKQLNYLKEIGKKPPEEKFWIDLNIEFKKKFAANCWHMSQYESYAMWKIYTKSNEGVAIQSTYKRLFECLDNTPNKAYLSAIKYIDFEYNTIDWGNRLAPFLHKMRSYHFEEELRAIITDTENYNLSEGGCKVKVDLKILIEKVYIAPGSPKWFKKLINNILENSNLNINNSDLDNVPVF